MVHSIMRHVAEKTLTPIETLYETIGWPLNKSYGHAIDAFKISITSVPLIQGSSSGLSNNNLGTPMYGRTSHFPARQWPRS